MATNRDKDKIKEAIEDLVRCCCVGCKDKNKECKECIIQKHKKTIMEALYGK